MNGHKPTMFHDPRFLTLVGKYATPLAILLVTLGIFFSQPSEWVRDVSVALLLFGLVFNLVFVRLAKNWPPTTRAILAKARLTVNVGVNLAIIYFLGGFWAPIWLLLALTPIATAIYGSRLETLVTAVVVSGLLSGVHALRGFDSPVEWGQQGAYAAFIILISLMINELSRLATEHRS